MSTRQSATIGSINFIPPTQLNTYRRQARPASARSSLEAGRSRPNAPKSLRIGKAVGIPGLGAREIVGVRVVVQRRVQALQPTGVVTSHVVIQVHRHRAVRVKLTRRLTVQRLLMALGARRTRRGVIVVHVLGLLIAHGGEKIAESLEATKPRNVGTEIHHTTKPVRSMRSQLLCLAELLKHRSDRAGA